MNITNLSIQDICTIIVTIITVVGAIWGLVKSVHFLIKKVKVKQAAIRANFFKSGSSWRLRIYNASESDIEAVNVKILIPESEGVYAHWDCDKDICPSLKRHARFDIHMTLCTSAPNFIPITIEWKQGKKVFSTIENVQLH